MKEQQDNLIDSRYDEEPPASGGGGRAQRAVVESLGGRMQSVGATAGPDGKFCLRTPLMWDSVIDRVAVLGQLGELVPEVTVYSMHAGSECVFGSSAGWRMCPQFEVAFNGTSLRAGRQWVVEGKAPPGTPLRLVLRLFAVSRVDTFVGRWAQAWTATASDDGSLALRGCPSVSGRVRSVWLDWPGGIVSSMRASGTLVADAEDGAPAALWASGGRLVDAFDGVELLAGLPWVVEGRGAPGSVARLCVLMDLLEPC